MAAFLDRLAVVFRLGQVNARLAAVAVNHHRLLEPIGYIRGP